MPLYRQMAKSIVKHSLCTEDRAQLRTTKNKKKCILLRRPLTTKRCNQRDNKIKENKLQYLPNGPRTKMFKINNNRCEKSAQQKNRVITPNNTKRPSAEEKHLTFSLCCLCAKRRTAINYLLNNNKVINL